MEYEMDFEDGMIVLSYKYEHEMGRAGVELEIDLIEALKKAAEKSDNQIDDKIVAMIEMALG